VAQEGAEAGLDFHTEKATLGEWQGGLHGISMKRSY
jgi:hypothetical protein